MLYYIILYYIGLGLILALLSFFIFCMAIKRRKYVTNHYIILYNLKLCHAIQYYIISLDSMSNNTILYYTMLYIEREINIKFLPSDYPFFDCI